jgi:kinesin family protein C1
VRPLLPKELEEKHSSEHISFENALDKGIEITREGQKDEKAEFQFDAVFKQDSTQIQIFGEGNFLYSSLIAIFSILFSVSQLVRSSLDGYNVTIFAYGQTGSGKTFSMEGPEDVYENEEMQGIIPRSFKFLIAVEKSKEKGWIYKLEASYLEVYCEELNDLLEGE